MEALEIGIITIMSCILFLSLIGNIALLVVVHGQLPYQTVRNYSYLILNLAISDILLASSSIPFDIVQRFTAPVFPFGPTMCKFLWPFQTICNMASIFTVGALSYQRYRLVVRPFNGKLKRRRFFIMLASIWVLPVILAGLPYSLVLRMDQNTSSCVEKWSPVSRQAQMKLGFTAYLFIIQYVLPLALIVSCNVKAIIELKRYQKHRRRTSMISALSIDHHENTVKLLSAIMTVFALFWLPGQVVSFLIEFESENKFILSYGLDICYLFAFTNCVMNPFIFAYFSQFHKNSTLLRKLPATSLGSCGELSYSGMEQRRRSLPENLKSVPFARSSKRPSLSTILKSGSITEEQRKNLLKTRRNKDFIAARKKSNSMLTQKKRLPVMVERQNSDKISMTQNNSRIKNSTQKRPAERLSFSVQNQDRTDNNNCTHNTQQTHTSQCSTEKRDVLQAHFPLTQRDSVQAMQSKNHSNVDAENRERHFLAIMKTMKEEVFRKYLAASQETELNY